MSFSSSISAADQFIDFVAGFGSTGDNGAGGIYKLSCNYSLSNISISLLAPNTTTTNLITNASVGTDSKTITITSPSENYRHLVLRLKV